MATNDLCCSFTPYFKIRPGKMDAFKALCEQFVERASQEPGCLFYGFSFNGDTAHCREGYVDAAGAIAHIENITDLIPLLEDCAEPMRSEAHGPEAELAKLRDYFGTTPIEYYVLEYGFRH